MDIAPKPFLVAQGGHPGTAVFRRTGEIVAEEEAAMAPGGVAHLPHPHVVMPDRDAVATLEGQAKQAVRGVERGLDDALELQIRLDRRLVDVAARLAQLFGVVAPVPRLEREMVMACLPASPRSSAAVRAAARTKSGRPARSSSPSSTSA